tara:strand:- start:365 stop:1060 length:696 start_codon:yes stop_codon:yes gene_type:complete
MKILGFVPARGGSIGIPKKNLTNLNGKPLIKYTLEISKKIGKSLRLFVSTDDQKILNFCKKSGYKETYIRPKKLSNSKSNIIDAIFHALNWLEEKHNYKPDAILLLEPTNPSRNIKEIKKAINLFKSKKIESLASACQLKFHPFQTVEINKRNWKFLKKKDKKIYQRQLYPQNYYFIDGNFYLVKIDFLKKYKTVVRENLTTIFKIKREYPLDINTPLDLQVVSTIMKVKK